METCENGRQRNCHGKTNESSKQSLNMGEERWGAVKENRFPFLFLVFTTQDEYEAK